MQRLGGGASLGALGRPCRISLGCSRGWTQGPTYALAGSYGLPTSGLGALAAGAGATGRQLSRNLGTSLLNKDFLPDLREQRASVAEAECSTLAESRFRGCLAMLVEAAAAAMPPWPCSATAAHFKLAQNQ